ncbi:hypothetical protein [Yinghuangia sp. YIM S09857]|uniref:hypothetical protein n=1 Tax=Yinghuangia sp. YIM S09857 TaxID=3436929 RepID=UPI003F536854
MSETANTPSAPTSPASATPGPPVRQPPSQARPQPPETPAPPEPPEPPEAQPSAVPAPIVPAAVADGGIGAAAVADPHGTVDVVVPYVTGRQPGDFVRLFWGTSAQPVAEALVEDRDDLHVPVPGPAVVEAGEGELTVFYDLRAARTGEWVRSAETYVRAKFSVPGEPPPLSDEPELNPELPGPHVASGIGGGWRAVGDGVEVRIEPYANMAGGDTVTLAWGSRELTGTLAPDEVGRALVFRVDDETVAAAGYGGIPVRYGIRDIAGNWSLWSTPTVVDVDAP